MTSHAILQFRWKLLSSLHTVGCVHTSSNLLPVAGASSRISQDGETEYVRTFWTKKNLSSKGKILPSSLPLHVNGVRLSSFELIFESWLSFKSIRFSVYTAPYSFLLQNYYRSKLSKILFIYKYPTWDTRRIEILSNSRSLPLLFVFHSFLSIYLSFFFLTENRSFQGMFLHGVFLPEQVQRFNGWNRVTKDMDVFWKV